MSEDEPIKIDFSGVPDRKGFALLPSGKYVAEITDYREDEASDEAKNPGAQMINWEFTLETDLEGNDTTTTTVRDPETKEREVVEVKIEGRRVWDNMVVIEAMLPRIKEFLKAQYYRTDGEIELWPEEMLSNRLIIDIGQQREKKDRKSGKEYQARNKVNGFHKHPDEAPTEEEPPAATPAEEKPKGKGKNQASTEGAAEDAEAKV